MKRFKKPWYTNEEKENICSNSQSWVQKDGCNDYRCTRSVKCRECQLKNQQDKEVCNFFKFRRLANTKNGLEPYGFNDPFSDADDSDKQLWLPAKENAKEDWIIATNRANYIIRQVGDKFCELIDQEKMVYAKYSEGHKVVWKRLLERVREYCVRCDTTLFNYHLTCKDCAFAICIDCYETRNKNMKKKLDWKVSSKDPDKSSWLLCNNKEFHVPESDSFLLTQIVAADCLDQIYNKLHECRTKWQILPGLSPLLPQISSLSESEQMYRGVSHSWLCNGTLLNLHEPNNPRNYRIFQDQWKQGQPVLVSGTHKQLDQKLWCPESFSEDFGENKGDLIDCMTGDYVQLPMKKFYSGFDQISERSKDSKGNPILLIQKDWPSMDNFAEISPTRFNDLMKCMPLSEYTGKDGRWNLVNMLPDIFMRPSLGPLMYNAYGSTASDTAVTTNLHVNVADTVNVMVYVGVSEDGESDEHIKEFMDKAGCDTSTKRRIQEDHERAGALWQIYKASDAGKIRDMLKEAVADCNRRVRLHHDPIHDEIFYLDRHLKKRLSDNGVEGYSIVQCLGDAIFVPAGAPYQVRNLRNCFNIEKEFVSPENILYCFQLTQEFRGLHDTHWNHEDKLQIKNVLYHAVKDSLTVLQASFDKMLDKSETSTTTATAATIRKDGCRNEVSVECAPVTYEKGENNEEVSVECAPVTYEKGENNEVDEVMVENSKAKLKCREVIIIDLVSSEEEFEEENELNFVEKSKPEKEKKQAKRKRGKEKICSDGETLSSEESPKGKRKRMKNVASDSESGEDGDSPSKRRNNIQKVFKHVTDDKKKAAQDKQGSLKRVAECHKLINEKFDAQVAGRVKVKKLVLELDEESKKELVTVHEVLVERLKPHQAQGIKFMWDACYKSLEQIKISEGSGCIIAHCMGLGKTFQVVTLIHTLITHKATGVKTIMVVCPKTTVLNWCNEFDIWLKHVPNANEIVIYDIEEFKDNVKVRMLDSWQEKGGVLILSYEMIQNLTSTGKKMSKYMQESMMKSLVDPGADLVICDEGCLLKNKVSICKAMNLVNTKRRIVLTSTPLQNNLEEYYCIVQFVKPNLLGTKEEFLNRFVNPIRNGQLDDSTPCNVKLMNKRAFVLHKILEGSVQRLDYCVLKPFLPPKEEYVIFFRLSDIQIKMYQHYLDNFARRFGGKNGSLFADYQALQRIWTHPYVLRLNAAKVDEEKKQLEAIDSKEFLKYLIDDEDDSKVSSDNSSESDSDVQCIISGAEKKNARLNAKSFETTEKTDWWSKYLKEEHFNDMRLSTKLMLLFGILKESEQIGDKVLVFSQSLYSLTLIEQFLKLINQESQDGNKELEKLDKHSGSWALGLDYFRLDGSTSREKRSAWCEIFNSPKNSRARLFLISTIIGDSGINLTAANRLIIFDASWNPSHDVQSIIRIYRFGQKKPCYIYRFLAADTMEEKIYSRQIANLSCKVVDEQEIERHYSNNNVAELYQFEICNSQSTNLERPKDDLLADLFLKYGNLVLKYHEHDSLLENKVEEELDEETRKQAWLEYEKEKQGK